MAKKNPAKPNRVRRPPPPRPDPEPVASAEKVLDGEGFGVVGIGASAGGLEAFTQFLKALPVDTGFAYVFVQHLDPKQLTLLNSLLQQQTQLPVCTIQDGTPLEPNHIYIIPPNTNLTVHSCVLALQPRPPGRPGSMTVDTFLRSLAEDQKGRAIGVVLSGNGSDGAAGIAAIKSAGGITFAQDDSAKFDAMPRNAAATGCVDFVLPPDRIAQELGLLGTHPYVQPRPGGAPKLFPEGNHALAGIISLVRAQFGVDFTHYKENTIKRRVLRRMTLKKSEDVQHYLTLLRADPAEAQQLYEDILINVTEFFRDAEVFEALKEVVFPQLASKHDVSPVRIWVPGCSRGEEVYSMAIAAIEFLEQRGSNRALQIFGTDISDSSLSRARVGSYGPEIAAQVSPERLKRFFLKGENGYQVLRSLRDVCIFAKQNLVKDPPFSRLDLISCRNVLIYLGPVLQRRALSMFHYALKPTGFLLLGSSESIGSYEELFTAADKKNQIYAPRAGPRTCLKS